MRGLLPFRYTGIVPALAVVLLAAALVLGLSPSMARAETAATVGSDEQVSTAVQALIDAGIMAGRDAASSLPEDLVTRGQLAGYLARALGLAGTETQVFTDIAADEWYAVAVGALYQAGLVSGTGPTVFAPDEPVSRQDAAAWVVAALGYRVAKDSDLVIPYRRRSSKRLGWPASVIAP
jgi:hypothetical protein